MPARPVVVDARNITKTYEQAGVAVPALRDVTLAVAKGEMVAVMGPSGCGKTTLLNCLSGLDQPESGAIDIEGRPLAGMPDDELTQFRALRMGFIFQSFNLLPVLTAVENTELPLLVSGVPIREARTRAEAALAEVGLSHRLTHKPRELSGGEQQRVAIARSIVNEPSIIWADEPTGNLDSETSAGIVTLLKGLNAQRGLTYVVVTHDPEIASACDRTVRMKSGRIESVDAPRRRR